MGRMLVAVIFGWIADLRMLVVVVVVLERDGRWIWPGCLELVHWLFFVGEKNS